MITSVHHARHTHTQKNNSYTRCEEYYARAAEAHSLRDANKSLESPAIRALIIASYVCEERIKN